MEPLWVIIELERPLALGTRPMHLDGLLSFARVEQAAEDGETDPWALQHDLPLERYTSPSGQWCFKASLLAPCPASEPFTVLLTGRIEAARVVQDRETVLDTGRTTKINPAGGYFKGSIFNQSVQWVDRLVASAVGEKAEIERLMQRITAVGRRRNIGFGAVRSVTVLPSSDEEAWSWRTLPSDADFEPAVTMALSDGNLHAPYWKRASAVESIEPIDQPDWLVGFFRTAKT